jgi:hypothetical protein
MKNKKLTYLLIFFVLIVWGIIVYRIVGAINQDDDLPVTEHIQIKESYNDFSVRKDTGSLKLNYRDPFSSPAKELRDTVIKHPVVIKKTMNAVVKPTFNWSMIRYSGYIRNPASKKLIAIMSINGSPAMLSEGESAGQITLLKNAKDSVKIKYQDQVKFIGLNRAAL